MRQRFDISAGSGNIAPSTRRSEKLIDKGVTVSGLNTCRVLARPVVSGLDTEEKVLGIIGHEIGHIFFGAGHPDDPAPNNRGVAPLQGTDHTKRLMYGNTKDADSRLCVKAEWEKAEVWLKDNPDRRELEQQNGQ